MKLMNFRRLDPDYTSNSNKSGLVRGSKGDELVWDEFAGDANRCSLVAQAIRASLDSEVIGQTYVEPESDIEEAPEGRLLTRTHLVRERDRKLVAAKRKQVLKEKGALTCGVCSFDYSFHYGERGAGFIECHHTKPLATLVEGQKTHINDLVLVCSNCHRMIHRKKPWLSVEELAQMYKEAPTGGNLRGA